MSLLEKKLKSVGITDMRIMMITTAVTQPLPPFFLLEWFMFVALKL